MSRNQYQFCMYNTVHPSPCYRTRVIGGVPDHDYKWDMRVIVATRCQGGTRDDGDRYFIPNLLIVILFPVYLCGKYPDFITDFSKYNSYAMK